MLAGVKQAMLARIKQTYKFRKFDEFGLVPATVTILYIDVFFGRD